MNRVLVFLPSSGLGGCEHYAEVVTAHLGTNGVDPYLAVPRLAALRAWVSRVTSLGVQVLQYDPGEPERNGFPEPAHQERVARSVVDSCAPDLVVAILPWPLAGAGIQAVIAAEGLRSVAVFQLFCRPLQLPLDLRTRYHEARDGGQTWVAVSDNNRRSIAISFAVPHTDIFLVPNGTEPQPWDGSRHHADRQLARAEFSLDPDSWLLLTIARLTAVKRVRLILEALALLSGFQPNTTLFVLGEGEEAADLKERVELLGLCDRVRFAGYVADPRKYLQAADLFVTASSCEGLAFSTLEAMAMSLPVVASAKSSHKELVREGIEGCLFSDDTADSLTRAIERVRSSGNAQEMGEAGRRRIVTSYTRTMMLSGLERAIAAAPPP